MSGQYLDDLRRSLAEELEESAWRDLKRLIEMNELARVSRVIRDTREAFPLTGYLLPPTKETAE